MPSNTLLWHATRSKPPIPSQAVVPPSASTAPVDGERLEDSADERLVILYEALPNLLFDLYRKTVVDLLGDRQNELAPVDLEAYHRVAMDLSRDVAGAHASFHTDLLKLLTYYAAKTAMEIDETLMKAHNPLLFVGGEEPEPVANALPDLIIRRGPGGEPRLIGEVKNATAGGSIVQGLESLLDEQEGQSLKMAHLQQKHRFVLKKLALAMEHSNVLLGMLYHGTQWMIVIRYAIPTSEKDALIISRPLSADNTSHSLVSYLIHALLLSKDDATSLPTETKEHIDTAAALAKAREEPAKRPAPKGGLSPAPKRPRGEEERAGGGGEGKSESDLVEEEMDFLKGSSSILDPSDLAKINSLSLSVSSPRFDSSPQLAASPLSPSAALPPSPTPSSSITQTLLRAPLSSLALLPTPPAASPTTPHKPVQGHQPPLLAISTRPIAGVHGTMYTGVLADGSALAIKCGTPELVQREAAFYERRLELSVPKYYGVWRSDNGRGIIKKEGSESAALLLEHGGRAPKHFGELTRLQSLGFEHCDFRPANVVVPSPGANPLLIDFTLADGEHLCRGEGICVELESAKRWLEI